MTNNDIIKALEIHASRGDCGECSYSGIEIGRCQVQMFRDCLDLINRQKAEIEWWSEKAKRYELKYEGECRSRPRIEKAKAEAIKEFAEAVKMEFYREFDEIIPSIMADKIDNLVKEITEETA